MAVRQDIIEKINQFKSELIDSGLKIDKSILFGSYAKGNANKWSDIDLLLVSPDFDNNLFDNIDKYAQVNIKFPEIEIHPYSTDNFKKEDLFLNEILKYGIRV